MALIKQITHHYVRVDLPEESTSDACAQNSVNLVPLIIKNLHSRDYIRALRVCPVHFVFLCAINKDIL